MTKITIQGIHHGSGSGQMKKTTMTRRMMQSIFRASSIFAFYPPDFCVTADANLEAAGLRDSCSLSAHRLGLAVNGCGDLAVELIFLLGRIPESAWFR